MRPAPRARPAPAATARTTRFGVGERGQLHPPHPALEYFDEILGDRQRQPRLARASGAAEGEKPPVREQPLDLGYLPIAPDEARQLERQVVERTDAGRMVVPWQTPLRAA